MTIFQAESTLVILNPTKIELNYYFQSTKHRDAEKSIFVRRVLSHRCTVLKGRGSHFSVEWGFVKMHLSFRVV